MYDVKNFKITHSNRNDNKYVILKPNGDEINITFESRHAAEQVRTLLIKLVEEHIQKLRNMRDLSCWKL